MPAKPAFHTQTALADALRRLIGRLAEQLPPGEAVTMVLAGGMAVHLYTANRVTTDVDAEFDRRVFLPNDLLVEATLEDGARQVVYFDANYNSSFALMHEDYLDDSIPLNLGVEGIRLRVLSPVDLAVSKIARFADNDREDIAALVRRGLTNADEIARRAGEALAGFVGGQAALRRNLADAVELARRAEAETDSVSKLSVPRRRAEDSAGARQGEIDKGTGNLETE